MTAVPHCVSVLLSSVLLVFMSPCVCFGGSHSVLLPVCCWCPVVDALLASMVSSSVGACNRSENAAVRQLNRRHQKGRLCGPARMHVHAVGVNGAFVHVHFHYGTIALHTEALGVNAAIATCSCRQSYMRRQPLTATLPMSWRKSQRKCFLCVAQCSRHFIRFVGWTTHSNILLSVNAHALL
jgi:hypothetical protein